MMAGAIFDLDGVLVDTAGSHFAAWGVIAKRLGIPFSAADNERLKGVGRMESLEIILSLKNVVLSRAEKEKLAAEKNEIYLDMLSSLCEKDILPGARKLLESLRANGIKIALGSGSRNAPYIVDRLGIAPLFDALVDGSMIKTAKPDPDVFLLAARMLHLAPKSCAVFEDAAAGIEAARRGGMRKIGVGSAVLLSKADAVVPDLTDTASIEKFLRDW